MSSSVLLSSHGLVLATAMAVSAGTIILLDLLKEKYSSTSQHSNPGKQFLKSCLSSSGSKKKDGKMKKKVHFADDVKDSSGNGEEYRNRKLHKKISRIHTNSCCGNQNLEIPGMPANQAALYNGMMIKIRLQRMAYSF